MPAPLVAKLSKKAGISKKRGEYLWGKAKKLAKGAKPSDFYAYTTGILKKMTGQESIDDLINLILIEDEDIDQDQLTQGIEVEREHADTVKWLMSHPEATPDQAFAMIAKDHLAEIPDYYTRLKAMEKSADDK
jgi:hypothetical protein